MVRFSCITQAMNGIEVANSLNHFSDNEESEWLANVDPSLFDKLSEEKYLGNNEIS